MTQLKFLQATKELTFLQRSNRWWLRLSLRSKIRGIWFTLIGIGIGWLITSYQAWGVGPEVMQSSEQVLVENTGEYLRFTPVTPVHNVTFIFYPGALVPARSYAPFARNIASQGYTTIIVKMPFRLASLGHEKALQIIKENTANKWVLGGHSLGAAKAAQFVYEHPDLLQGLILIGSSHPREINLSGHQLDVTKIYASEDGLASVEEVMQFKKNLPVSAHFVEIPGGNHVQFGYYGDYQLGDRPATINRETQQKLTIEATLAALERISAN